MEPWCLAFIRNFSAFEITLIFLAVLLLFGAKRLPELFKSFGKSVKEFKKATSEIEDDIRTAMDSEETPTKRTQNLENEKPPTTESNKEVSTDSDQESKNT